MNPVTFPYVSETYNRAVREVLGEYFDAGGAHTLLGQSLNFYRCEFAFNIERIAEPATRPRITITGTRSEENCLGTCTVDGELVDLLECNVRRSLYVSIPKQGEFPLPPYDTDNVEVSSYRIIDRVWGQLNAVLNAKMSDWKLRNIRSISLEPVPIELHHDSFYIGRGLLKATAHVTRPRS